MKSSFLKKKTNLCSCKAHSKVYEDSNLVYEYMYDFSFRKNENDVDVLVLMEFMEPENNFNFLKRFCNSYLKDFNYVIIPALACTPFNFGSEDTIVTYSHCKELHIKKNIEKYKPKVILTIGRSLYTITESKDLKPENFFVPVNDALLSFQKDDTWLYSPEFNCKIFPIPALYQWVHSNGSPKDVYEFKFSIAQIKRLIESLYESRIRIKKIDYEIIKNSSDILDYFASNSTALAIDTESSGLNYLKDELYSIQFAENDHKGYFCYWKNIDKKKLSKMFDNKNKTIIMHNSLHDIPFLISNGIENVRCDFDTMLCSHILNENSPQGLKPNAWIYTCYGGYEESLKKYMKEHKLKDYTEVPIDILSKYSAYDPIITYQLYLYQKDRLEKEDPDIKFNFYNYVMPSVSMTVDMQMEGVPVDIKYMYEYNDSLEKELCDIKNKIFTIVGKEFNLRSPIDLSYAFKNSKNFKILLDKDDKPLLTKNGDLVLNKITLLQYEEMGVKIAGLIKKANHISKEISQLGISSKEKEVKKGIFSLRNEDSDEDNNEEGYMQSMYNNRLYGAYKLHGTDTGRAASGSDKDQQESIKISRKGSFGINFQNIPAKENFRKMFLAPIGYVLGNADYDSMEVSIFSQLSGKGVFEDIILSGKDMHCYTLVAVMRELKKEGMLYFYNKFKDVLPLKNDTDIKKYLNQFDFENIEYNEVKNKVKIEEDPFFVEMRSKVGKITDWQVLYGSSGYGLAKNLGVETEVGDAILLAFKKMYPDVDKYMQGQAEFAKKYGYVKTLLGRKRRLPELTYIGTDSRKNYQSSFSISNLINNSFNSPAQGTSGQVTLIAMTNIHKELKEKNMKSKLIINVHDELVMITYISEINQVKDIVEKWMTHKYYEAKGNNEVTLHAEFEIGEIWKNCKSVDYWDKNLDEFKNMILNIEKRNNEMKIFLREEKYEKLFT